MSAGRRTPVEDALIISEHGDLSQAFAHDGSFSGCDVVDRAFPEGQMPCQSLQLTDLAMEKVANRGRGRQRLACRIEKAGESAVFVED
jgi:hypothetical protein